MRSSRVFFVGAPGDNDSIDPPTDAVVDVLGKDSPILEGIAGARDMDHDLPSPGATAARRGRSTTTRIGVLNELQGLLELNEQNIQLEEQVLRGRQTNEAAIRAAAEAVILEANSVCATANAVRAKKRGTAADLVPSQQLLRLVKEVSTPCAAVRRLKDILDRESHRRADASLPDGTGRCGKTSVSMRRAGPSCNPYNAYVVCASTGKAAVAVGGTTVHAAFKLCRTNSNNTKYGKLRSAEMDGGLSHSEPNTFRVAFRTLLTITSGGLCSRSLRRPCADRLRELYNEWIAGDNKKTNTGGLRPCQAGCPSLGSRCPTT
ncbi:hypothetical protein HPB48_000165 [Haemaphysalis longicornis]|uniref:Uncharacterized protein n=1 Tax=Haemaphysalis longicornis TaxID=44386 RepID=A0A9J6G1L3_HAELO|nr:hypothetical protein HPB48_000165 [Haemaphysalis longicornis]